MKILNFGSCNIDYVYSLDHIVQGGETEAINSLEIFPGGKGLNQSVAIARAGAPVYHAGCIGEGGEFFTQILTQNGVDISHLKQLKVKNGHAIIQVSSDGENAIFLYAGSNYMVTKSYIDKVLDNFDEGDILLLQNEINNVDYIIEQAYKKKMCIVLNPAPMTDSIKKIDLSMLSYIVVNETEAKALTGEITPDGSLTYFSKNYPGLKVVITLGSKGCIYKDTKKEIYQPAFKVNAVDTTSAGDTFIGYFIKGIWSGLDIPQTLKISCAASAITVERMGATPSIPKWQEAIEALITMSVNRANSKDDILARQIEKYICENIKTACVNTLSKRIGYSTVHTGVIVKRVMGQPFSKVLQDKRCAIAAQKLLTTNMSVEQISDEVGYANKSFFRKIFRQKYGMNPLDFRKNDKTVNDAVLKNLS